MKHTETNRAFFLGSMVAALLVVVPMVTGSVALAGPRKAPPKTAVTTVDGAKGVVNINTASLEELQRLPGVGKTRAEAIVKQRKARPFQRVEDVLRVKGVGRATFRKLRSMMVISGPTTMPKRTPPPKGKRKAKP
ncbi:MAG: helix-hairpin-helix domain-containing protein [Myxococcales bacterium]|nr:helix-hairpin-helix domain-containing protein [Myxococcales bacterium]